MLSIPVIKLKIINQKEEEQKKKFWRSEKSKSFLDQEDHHLPFSSLTFDIAQNMQGAPKKPFLKLQINEE